MISLCLSLSLFYIISTFLRNCDKQNKNKQIIVIICFIVLRYHIDLMDETPRNFNQNLVIGTTLDS